MSIILTENAIEKLNQVRIENNYINKVIRFKVQGGGCAGFLHSLDFIDIDQINDDDLAFEFEDESNSSLILIIDPKSYSFTEGTVIDYQKTLLDSKFIFNNPHATGGCGCGNSFSIN